MPDPTTPVRDYYDAMLPSLRAIMVDPVARLVARCPSMAAADAANAAAEGVLALLDALERDGYVLKRKDGTPSPTTDEPLHHALRAIASRAFENAPLLGVPLPAALIEARDYFAAKASPGGGDALEAYATGLAVGASLAIVEVCRQGRAAAGGN